MQESRGSIHNAEKYQTVKFVDQSNSYGITCKRIKPNQAKQQAIARTRTRVQKSANKPVEPSVELEPKPPSVIPRFWKHIKHIFKITIVKFRKILYGAFSPKNQ